MVLSEAKFDNESELDSWIQDNHTIFFPESLFIDAFKITTSSGKGGIPDGFVFDLRERVWYVIECELLSHGVWPHIAEQITRFIVALQNPDTLRLIRNKLFEHIISSNLINESIEQLGTSQERFLQEIELYIETIRPEIIIFIDETNQDLVDFAHAIDLPIRIYSVKKLVIDGQVQYYSPEHKPIIETKINSTDDAGNYTLRVLDQLGGGTLSESTGRFKCYDVSNGNRVHLKYSKLHERNNYYWYGVNPSTMEHIQHNEATHLIFIMGEYGFAMVPVGIVREYIKTAKVSKNSDGSIRHHHVLISNEPDPEMFWSAETPRFSLTESFEPFT